jgi:hypothetical protein
MKTGDRGAESKIGATASDQNNHGCLRRDTTLDHIQHMLNIYDQQNARKYPT